MQYVSWLALVIGNSRYHWAYFHGETLLKTWDSSYITPELLPQLCQGQQIPNQGLDLYIASVVPQETQLWLKNGNYRLLTLDDIPLTNLYSTMGIDRALAVWGAGQVYQFPCLVVDGGTALTLTGVNRDLELVGGAILPGLGLQLRSLAVNTAALPQIGLNLTLPERWAVTTPGAIASGVIYTILAGIRDFLEQWWQKYPSSRVIFTGGDGQLLQQYLQDYAPELTKNVNFDANLSFWGVRSLWLNNDHNCYSRRQEAGGRRQEGNP